VQGTHFSGEGFDRRGETSAVGDISDPRGDLAAASSYSINRRLETAVVNIDGGDRGALGCRQQCGRTTDAATGARDDHNPAVETTHGANVPIAL